MSQRSNSMVEVALIVMGIAVMVAPNGWVARTGFEFGEYKYVAGVALLLLGSWMLLRRKSRDRPDFLLRSTR
jgi:hypothetical protein